MLVDLRAAWDVLSDVDWIPLELLFARASKKLLSATSLTTSVAIQLAQKLLSQTIPTQQFTDLRSAECHEHCVSQLVGRMLRCFCGRSSLDSPQNSRLC